MDLCSPLYRGMNLLAEDLYNGAGTEQAIVGLNG